MKHERADRRFDPFRVLGAEERVRHLEDYLAFLGERDGEIDTDACTLSKRESYFRDLGAKPVEWEGETDAEGFYRHFRGTGTPEIGPRTVWLLAAAKANVGEAYGVEVELASFRKRPDRATENPLYLHLMFEEQYHTRILGEICRTCGVEPERREPPWIQRVMIHAMMQLPDRLRWIPILAGEVLGSEVFKLLREGVQHYGEQPEVEDRLRSLLTEIWIDEVFHVAYLRAKLGPLGIRVARRLLPLVARSVMRDVPQLHRLGWTRETVLARIRRGIEIPPGVDWMAPDPAPDSEPDPARAG